jgi:ATP-dependent DNA ligase
MATFARNGRKSPA